MSNPNQGQDPVAGAPSFPKGEQVHAQSHAQAGSAQCTPEALKAEGCTEEQAQKIHQAVGAGISLATILSTIVQRLPQAMSIVEELLHTFQFQGKNPNAGGQPTQKHAK